MPKRPSAPVTSAGPAPRHPTPESCGATAMRPRSLGDFYALQRDRMEVGLDALALAVERVHFITSAVDLHVAHIPAFLLQLRSQRRLRLPFFRRSRGAGD